MPKTETVLDEVTIRFAGDSGDGMQLTGSQFTHTSALVGNDVSTFPDYPAEIRAPAGSLFGVSGFQLHFSSKAVLTPGDAPDVLVAMNPAALKTNLGDLKVGGILIANTQAFDDKNLERAGYATNPLEDGSLGDYRVYPVDITTMTLGAVAEVGLGQKAALRCKNFFALGLVYWLFNRPLEHTLDWLKEKFHGDVYDANEKALKAGYHYGETAEAFDQSYVVEQAQIEPGLYRNITGNEALALGLLAACQLSGLKGYLGSYPITPASDILHFLSKQKHLGFKTFQAEDEIAAVGAALGAAFAGGLGVTTTSGPGMALKAEAIGLAVMTELPMVIVNVQRGGPSTGLPTKTEQSDLLQMLYGRNGESPVPIVAAQSPGDCFYAAIEAARIAVRHSVPVVLLSDGYVANGAEPWKVPKMADLPRIPVRFATEAEGFEPYSRDDDLGRPWAIPGTPGLEHRLGGLEKQHLTGNVSYNPENHEFMCQLRADKVAKVADHLPPTAPHGDADGTLVIGWGGTFGALRAAVDQARQHGAKAAHVHLRHLNPLPKDLGEVMARYERVLVPELNLGQLSFLLRAKYLRAVEPYTKLQGKPFKVSEVLARILEAKEVAA
ncbi:MAG: 2-oxoacid:acceptor oxidoreductase subunit alpha [Myxococcales bacterium]|nr:2-oxoacid:acceptor oxidoreductase subunit alpha [Myxococcales bacterium]